MSSVRFFNEDIVFKLPKPRKTATWIKSVFDIERQALISLTYIFCSDDYLLEINQEYLKHDTFTDIVTFDNSDNETTEGDIFISVERVRENADRFNRPFQEELHRVIIHGALHLIGYKDKTKRQKLEMRKKEDAYLSLPSVPRETFR